jgi:membrane protein EpsK
MQSSLHEAKKRLLVNVGTNNLVVLVGAIIGIWQTPYLIRHLGVKVYGMIPFVTSLIVYLNLVTMSIVKTVSRYVSIHLDRDEIEESNVYFNSALGGLIILCGVLFIVIVLLSVVFDSIFQVPAGFETSTNWLFFFIMVSSLAFTISSPFQVSTFVTHRFDLSNLVGIFSKFLRVTLLVLCFKCLSASLEYFGLSYCAMALFYLICFVALTKFLVPELHIEWKLFNWSALGKMGHMSVWIMVNHVGAVLYFSSSYILINLFLGPEQCGRYGPIAMWVMLLGALGGATSKVFAPIAIDYIANDRIGVLVFQMRRSIKFMGLIMGLPVGLLCGLAAPLLTRWVGPLFADLTPLVWLLIGPWLINIAAWPMFPIFMGLDKVKVPAIVTLVIGVINVVLTILLVRHTGLGIYGVALSLLLCWVAKNLFFVPMYAAVITEQPKTIFLRPLIPCLIMAALVSTVALVASLMYDLATIPRLLAVVVLMGAIYVPLCYRVVMSKEDRVLLRSLVFK